MIANEPIIMWTYGVPGLFHRLRKIYFSDASVVRSTVNSFLRNSLFNKGEEAVLLFVDYLIFCGLAPILFT